MKIKKQLSRKQLRKQKKLQKKQKTRQYHQAKSYKNNFRSSKPTTSNTSKMSKQNTSIKSTNKQPIAEKENKLNSKNINSKPKQVEKEVDSEDERIEMYEQKLGIKGKNKKYGSLAKKMGFDDDLFSFLDNISKKVKTDNYEYQNQQQNQIIDEEDISQMQNVHEDMQDEGEQENDQLMGDAMQEFDNLQNEHYEDQEIDPSEQYQQQQQQVVNKSKAKAKKTKQVKKQQKIIKKQAKQNKQQKVKKTKSKNNQVIKKKVEQVQQESQKTSLRPNLSKIQQNSSNQHLQVQKKMNSLFNKLSDGNLLITFREFISIFYNHPKSITHSIFSALFTKFNLMIQKPLVHVMSANIVIAVSLHRAFGDKLMAQVLYQLTQGFQKLQKQQQNIEQIQQLGYSKLFEKKKNYITIICFLYQFGSISASFPQSLVEYLSQNISNKENIQLIYQIVQKCGVRMRSNDPGTLKEVIQILRKMIDQSKKNGTFQTTKIKFIEIQINQIRFNKKGLFDADQRMGFLHTFLTKTIKQETPVQVRTIDATFEQFSKTLDTTKPQFWLEESKQLNNMEQQNENKNKKGQPNEEVKALFQLAKTMHFVTQIKRNIFVQLISSQDYIQAAKKILDLRVKRLEDIATVLAEVNLQQSSFNPFYSLVACKIAQQIPKFRVCLQFAIWDRLKQILSYDIRKISNLGKFTAWLISSQSANSSLSILKYFPDLLNLKSLQDIFLQVFFKEFLKKSQKNWINRLAHKLKQDKNKVIRDGVKDYLGELLPNLPIQKQKENAILLRKLLAVQFETQIENQ